MIRQQSGAALIISLMILLVLTILGLSSMRTSTTEELMARNTRDYKIAFDAADSTVNEGNKWVHDLNVPAPECADPTSCGNGGKVYKKHALGNVANRGRSWWAGNNTKEFGQQGSKDIPQAKSDPRYAMESTFIRDSLVQGHGVPTGKHVYTISGRGTGLKDSTQVFVQQTVVKRFN